MLRVRRAEERGHFELGWLSTHHTFSFGEYHDPAHMGFRSLRVLNEDRVAPGEGFPAHGHRDMEILTWVVSGALRHEDSMGNGSVLRPGEAQRMSAGRGVTHSEFNDSVDEPCHLLQIWILPERTGLVPGYQQKAFSVAERTDRLCLIASRDERAGSVALHQDVSVHTALLASGARVRHALERGRHAWLQVVRGTLELSGTPLAAGDGAAMSLEESLEIRATSAAELLLFDLA